MLFGVELVDKGDAPVPARAGVEACAVRYVVVRVVLQVGVSAAEGELRSPPPAEGQGVTEADARAEQGTGILVAVALPLDVEPPRVGVYPGEHPAAGAVEPEPRFRLPPRGGGGWRYSRCPAPRGCSVTYARRG